MKCSPCLLVNDVVETVEFYRDRLGFQTGELFGEKSVFAICHREEAEIMFKKFNGNSQARPNAEFSKDAFDLYFRIEDILNTFEYFRNNGVKIIQVPIQREYGMTEFLIEDCNGYRLCFAQDNC